MITSQQVIELTRNSYQAQIDALATISNHSSIFKCGELQAKVHSIDAMQRDIKENCGIEPIKDIVNNNNVMQDLRSKIR